jgi:hypothetical protein
VAARGGGVAEHEIDVATSADDTRGLVEAESQSVVRTTFDHEKDSLCVLSAPGHGFSFAHGAAAR